MVSRFVACTVSALLLVITVALTRATIEEVRATFVAQRQVTNSHAVLPDYSMIQCVRACLSEGQKGMCNVAGYNKVTQTCYLSMDDPQDVVSVGDKNIGVFSISHIAQGILTDICYSYIPCYYSYKVH